MYGGGAVAKSMADLMKYNPVARRFWEQHLENQPWFGIVKGLVISLAVLVDPSVKEEEKNDVCLVVALEIALPEDVTLPKEFEGLRVFWEVRGPVYLA